MRADDLSMRLPDPSTFGPDYDAQFKPARNAGQRDYLGARMGRGPSWINALQRKDAEIRKDGASLRAHSRHLDNNNPWMRNYLRIFVADIAGPNGFTLQARVKKQGSKNELLTDFCDECERKFKKWGRLGTCTVDGRYSWLAVQQLTARTLPLDGEVFIREIWGAKNEFGYALQFLDADLLDHTFNQEPGNGRNAVVLGVELDSWGNKIAYWFRASSTAYSAGYPFGGNRYRIPAEQIIHVLDPERVNQTRGVPFAAPVMYPLSMLGAYLENELAASKFESQRFMGLENDGTGDDEAGRKAANRIVSDGLFVEVLPPGFRTTTPDLRHPNSALSPYVLTMLHMISAGLGVSYHGIARDPSEANYTSTRADDMVDRPQKQCVQQLFIDILLERVYRNWLQASVLSGAIALPRGLKIEDALEHRWTPYRRQQLDPLKEGQASVLKVNNALNSRTNLLAEEGLDFEEVVDQLSYEERYMRDKGVTLTPTTVPSVPAEDNEKKPKKGESNADAS